ncbi:hypothetical protein QL285_048339 [Trifolium repens]|nr:hypothetical protein QL285_048339 [Trifolium repens]
MKTCENKVVSAIKGIVIREKSLVGLDFTDPIACIIRISYTGSSYQSILSHITHVRVRFQSTMRIPLYSLTLDVSSDRSIYRLYRIAQTPMSRTI